MSSEEALWVYTRNKLKPFIQMHRVENSVVKGMPDVHYVQQETKIAGWIELKETYPPLRPTTPVVCTSLTKDQVDWHLNYWGRVFTLMQIGREYSLLDPLGTKLLYARAMNLEQLRARSLHYGSFHIGRIIRCITS